MQRQILALIALVVLGIALEAYGLVEWSAVLDWSRSRAAAWPVRLALLIIAAQVALFTLAQPGSILFWAAALLYTPPVATAILTAGATAGAAGAYLLARRVARSQARSGTLFRLLERQGDFFTLCALRVLPGMPHSALNYASGILALPLPRFIAASALGLAIKSYVYARAVHEVIGTARPSDLVRLEVLGPLFAIALLLLGGRFGRPAAPRR